MDPLIAVALLGAGGAAAVVALRKQHVKAWRDFFGPRPGYVVTGRWWPTVTFSERGFTFTLRLATARRKNGPQFHHLRVEPAPAAVAFKVRHEHAGHKVLHWMGVDDIQVGDPKLDAALWFESPNPDALRAFFSSRRPLVALKCFYERAGPEATLEVTAQGASIFWQRSDANPQGALDAILGCLELAADLQATSNGNT